MIVEYGILTCRDFNLLSISLIHGHTSLSPDGKVIAIVGDNPDGMLVDSQTGKTVAHLHGHLDFYFASAWHPNGLVFATGNQDKTCRVWDARNLSKSIAVLKGNLGAIRSIRFTSDGQYMAMAEPADFVHVYDANRTKSKRLTSLVRSLESLSVQIQNLCSLRCGITPMVAFFSTTDAETIHIWTYPCESSDFH